MFNKIVKFYPKIMIHFWEICKKIWGADQYFFLPHSVYHTEFGLLVHVTVILGCMAAVGCNVLNTYL